MKSALFLLLIGIGINSCEEGSCERSGIQLHQIKCEEVPIGKKSINKHFITDTNCKLLDEWLSRKNTSQFLFRHISFKSDLNMFIGSKI